MAYYNGSANDLAALRAALTSACVSDGWTWNATSQVLSKGAAHVQLIVVGNFLTLRGQTSAAGGAAPTTVRIGTLQSQPLVWPLSYEVFAFDQEVYMVINYSADLYQWCAFGLSSIDLPGTGMFVAATLGHADAVNGITIGPATGDSYSSETLSPGIFWGASSYSPASTINRWQAGNNYYLHADLDGHGWSLTNLADNSTNVATRIGVAALAPLVAVLPNSWNSEAVLLPIRCWKYRAANKISLTAELEHARYTRVDHYEPGQIITLGEDHWKVFPFYRKNIAARNGGSLINHTGTLGWAIRYEGP